MRGKLRWLLAPLPLLALGVIVAAGRPSESTCQTGVRTVLATDAGTSNLLEALSACALPERKLAYAELSLAQRRALWNSHLASFAQEEGLLTDEQRETLARVIAGLGRYIAVEPKGRLALEEDGLSAVRLRAVFGDSLGKALFAVLGPDDRIDGHTAGETRAVTMRDGNIVIVRDH